jgi:FSR family fosmidomycin resistance protein-like MFS transporter
MAQLTAAEKAASPAARDARAAPHQGTALTVLFALSFCHLINDMTQSLLPALYPHFKETFSLSFTQVGLITLVNQLTASLLQPVAGLYTDRRPRPQSLTFGMGFTTGGLVLLAFADTFEVLLIAAALVGVGSSIFHPESSRVARLASGGRHGFAQALFQVGGNFGSALGPLLAAFVLLARGQGTIAWFALFTFLAMAVLFAIGLWYRKNRVARAASHAHHHAPLGAVSRGRVAGAVSILMVLIFSKYFYLGSLTTFYTFYLIDKFGVPVQDAQIYLFVLLGAVAAGTFIGGPLGDRFGRKYIIWISILGVLPFTLALPYVGLVWTVALTVVIGLVLASAFSAIVVYGQELMPGNVGMVAGLFFGFAFGVGGLGAAALGAIADAHGIDFVYRLCSYLPALGLLTAFLPNIERRRAKL